MPIKSVYYLQSRLYEILSEAKDLPKIYLSIQQDAKYPFILINMQKAIDLSRYSFAKYEIDFEICIFVREKGRNSAIEIANILTNSIKYTRLSSADYNILSIKMTALEFVAAQDLLTTKLVMHYKTLIAIS